MRPISNPHIRDVITIDDAFSALLSTYAGDGPIYLLARLVDQQADLAVGPLSVVIVADELRGRIPRRVSSASQALSAGLNHAVGAADDDIDIFG